MSLGNNWRIKIRCERIRSYSGIFYKTTKRLVACIQMHLASFWPRQPLHREGKKSPFSKCCGRKIFWTKSLFKNGKQTHAWSLWKKETHFKAIFDQCSICAWDLLLSYACFRLVLLTSFFPVVFLAPSSFSSFILTHTKLLLEENVINSECHSTIKSLKKDPLLCKSKTGCCCCSPGKKGSGSVAMRGSKEPERCCFCQKFHPKKVK